MKKYLKKITWLRRSYRLVKALCCTVKKHDSQPIQEIALFKIVEPECDIVFDVGCREDIEYLKVGINPKCKLYLFEPNPRFAKKLKKTIKKIHPVNEVVVSEFGFGREKGMLTYYPDSQSFVQRSLHFQSEASALAYRIDTISNFCSSNNINKIDFLKIDVEGMELDVLLGGREIITKTCKYIQFEFASTMLDAKIDPEDIYRFFSENFDLYLLRLDPGHPMYGNTNQLLTPYSGALKIEIEACMRNAFGCNLFAIRKHLDYPAKLRDEFHL